MGFGGGVLSESFCGAGGGFSVVMEKRKRGGRFSVLSQYHKLD